ncbi:MAG TPA: NAD(+) diphosphatase [Candidatus Dormibacteraeota bacterium]|nr:NAD(+) diphosphatase [Candidatus Dormibacteraeota bacterium]
MEAPSQVSLNKDAWDPSAAAFAFVDAKMLVLPAPQVRVPLLSELERCGTILGGPFEVSRPGERAAVALSMTARPGCPGLELKGLRELFGLLPEADMEVAARAFQTLEWSAAHAFCGRCGAPTVYSTTETARNCPSCGAIFYPRITPAVITLVRRGPEILLARGLRFGPRFYSLIAGFVEAGETLEQAVEREVFEEVGIKIRDISYYGSQSWPFPSQLMVGFTANHADGELRINHSEISDARWCAISELPGGIDLPTKYSISGRLIRSVLVPTPSSGAER